MSGLLLGELSENSWEHDSAFLSELSSGNHLEIFLLLDLFTFFLGDGFTFLNGSLDGVGDLLISILQLFLEFLGNSDSSCFLRLNLLDFIAG